MIKKKKGYGILLILTVLITLSGLITLIPYTSASKECMLGYKALCTFAPLIKQRTSSLAISNHRYPAFINSLAEVNGWGGVKYPAKC